MYSLAEYLDIMLIEFLVSALIECFADLFHKLVIEIEVMKYRKAHSEAFVCLEEVADIGTAVETASGTLTIGIDGSVVLCESLVEEVDLTLPGEEISVARVTAGHYAVKEIDSAAYSLNNIERSTYTHKVTNLILGHIGFDSIDDAVHIFGSLADSETSDRVTVEIKLCNRLHILDSQILIGTFVSVWVSELPIRTRRV